MRPLISLFCLIFILGLTGCSSVKERDRVGVKEAKACVKANAAKKIILDNYKITACTSNGVWTAVNIQSGEIFDFLNQDYTNAQRTTISLNELDDQDQRLFLSLRIRINKELLDLYY